MRYETRCDKVDWPNLKTEVLTKLEYLRIAWAASERDAPPELHKRMVEDLYVPAVRLLAVFCACLEVTEDDHEENKGGAKTQVKVSNRPGGEVLNDSVKNKDQLIELENALDEAEAAIQPYILRATGNSETGNGCLRLVAIEMALFRHAARIARIQKNICGAQDTLANFLSVARMMYEWIADQKKGLGEETEAAQGV